MATTLSNLGAIAARRGENSAALDWYLQALHIREYVLGKHSVETVATMTSIADLYEKTGDRKQAAEFRRQAEINRQTPETRDAPMGD